MFGIWSNFLILKQQSSFWSHRNRTTVCRVQSVSTITSFSKNETKGNEPLCGRAGAASPQEGPWEPRLSR